MSTGTKIEWCKWDLGLRDHKGGDPDEWPADLRVREWPNDQPPSGGRRE